MDGGKISIASDAEVYKNTADKHGGGMFVKNGTISGSQGKYVRVGYGSADNGNSARWGAGIYVGSGSGKVTFEGKGSIYAQYNVAADKGGGIQIEQGTLTVSDPVNVYLTWNKATTASDGYGGGLNIYDNGHLIHNSTKTFNIHGNEAKDHGGFVAGALKGGRRKIDTVELRSMVALDGDRIDKAFLENYEENAPYTSLLYTTHSSTEDRPRVRLVYPLTHDVTPEEFVAVSRYLADMLGIDYFDECSYQPNQLMY